MDNNIIAERLRIAREKVGITKAEASRRLNLSKIGYCRYESGERTPSVQTLEVIALCFGTSVSYLTGESDEMTPDKIVIEKSKNPALFDVLQMLSTLDDDVVRRVSTYAASFLTK